ncbi:MULTISPECIES: hypothetical protein [Actinosynnema]|uniref:hypothetical protein n=1 Tax=Actinosynnema TaxID=40566 RepID=UPI0020A5347E|nr:hypothetical protein [Actinosynnema pretiosum]MCP2097597.1 hypothetical protein [Actinosynnema pretiosum]
MTDPPGVALSPAEIAVPAGNFPEVRARFPDHVLDAVGDGRIWADAGPAALAATHQTWVRDPVTDAYLLDVLREPHDGTTWVFRHDPAIRLPRAEVVERTSDGVPRLAPDLVLLFKAKRPRPKDQADFDRVVPRLPLARRHRLAALLARAHPGHQWLTRL